MWKLTFLLHVGCRPESTILVKIEIVFQMARLFQIHELKIVKKVWSTKHVSQFDNCGNTVLFNKLFQNICSKKVLQNLNVDGPSSKNIKYVSLQCSAPFQITCMRQGFCPKVVVVYVHDQVLFTMCLAHKTWIRYRHQF